jgi:hypothetical protein
MPRSRYKYTRAYFSSCDVCFVALICYETVIIFIKVGFFNPFKNHFACYF